MSKAALVIMYDGKEPDDIVKSVIGNALTKSGYCNCSKDINIYFASEEDIIQAVAARALSGNIQVITEHFYKEGLSDLEKALVIIAKYCPTLEATSDVSAFQIELAYKFAQAYYTNKNIELIEAVRKVSKTYPEISIKREIAARYHYDMQHYNVIKSVSDSYV